MLVDNLIESVKGHMIYGCDSGYLIIIFTPQRKIDINGKQQDAFIFDIVGPFEDPDNYVLDAANILDGYDISYNIQVIKGQLNDDLKIMPSIDIFNNVIAHRKLHADKG